MLKIIDFSQLETKNVPAQFSKSYAGKGLYVKTFGCQMNEYDSKKISEILAKSHGLIEVDTINDASIVLMNTCSIREKAQEKVFSQLGRWLPWKQSHTTKIIGVGGCVASQEGRGIRQRAPYVDIIFGPQTIHRLPKLLENIIQSKQKAQKARVSIDLSFPEIEKFDSLPLPTCEGVTALVSIMEGCSKYCSFCVVPYTRGEEFSRPLQLVLNEIQSLANQGVREVTLLGQNVNAYLDRSVDGSIYDFATLLAEVANIDGIERIRYTTSHPIEVTDNLIQCHREIPELVNQMHLPVQSGSDSILKLMKRGYSSAQYLEIIDKLREVQPNIELSSDFIVGFPAETEKDFQATIDLVQKVKFDKSFSFIYSARPGTPATDLKDSTPMTEKKQRLYRLQKLLNEQMAQSMQAKVGTQQKVLIESLSKYNLKELTGRASNNTSVISPGTIKQIGQFVNVKIEQAFTNSLKGYIV